MILDYPTILFFLAINNLFIIALYTYQYLYHHKKWYLSTYIVGILFQTIAFVLIGNRSVLSHLLSVEISNFFLISSFALTSFALASFDGKLRKNTLWLFVVCTILFYFSFLSVDNNNTIRIIIQIIASSFFYGIGAFYLFFNHEKYKFSKILSIVLLTYSIFQLVRAFMIFQIGQSYDFMKGSTIDNYYLIISVFVISASSIGLIMLLKEIDQKTIVLKNTKIQQDKLKLEELNVTKDKLFSIIAHDLRGPFNSIIGFSDLIIKNKNENRTTQSKKYAGLINSSATSTLVLLDNLLNWAKLQTEQVYFKPEKQNLASITLEVFTLLTPIANKKNITLNYCVSDDVSVFTDQYMILTILRNLISNAIKFTNPDGKIDVYASQVDKCIEIAVSDNGVGIDDETQKKLFSLASNKSSSGTANEKGTGLGLILCKDFIEKHGGKIWVESKLGKGSTFKFSLPMDLTSIP